MPPKGRGAKNKSGMGRALIKRHQQVKDPGYQTSAKAEKQMSSILEVNSLDDFLTMAIMQEREFKAFKERDLMLLDPAPSSNHPLNKGASVKTFEFQQLKVRVVSTNFCSLVLYFSLPCFPW